MIWKRISIYLRLALGIDRAMEEISINKNILYDPKAVSVCLKLFKKKEFKFQLKKSTVYDGGNDQFSSCGFNESNPYTGMTPLDFKGVFN